MKKGFKFIFVVSFLVIILGIVALYRKEIFLGSAKVNTAQTILSDELQIKYKTLNSINISWENIQVPDNTASYNVYKDNQLVGNTTTSNYIFSSLTSGTAYSFKVEYIDSTGVVLLTKILDNVTVASTISSFNQSATYTKDTYYISGNLTIPAGVTINFEAGSVIKMYTYQSLTVNGNLYLNGTTDEKVTFTSNNDINYGGSGSSVCWRTICVGSTGSIELNNTVVKYGGDTVANGNLAWINSTYGNVKINNSNVSNVIGGGPTFTNGTLEVLNSTINSDFIVKDVSNLNMQGSTIYSLNLTYSNQTQQNLTDIENNTIRNGIVYVPNILSAPIIKNNNFTNISSSSCIKISLLNASNNSIDNISGNTSNVSDKYGEIQIQSIPNSGEIVLPKRVYYIANYLTIPNATTITVMPGSVIKLFVIGVIDVNGKFNLQGSVDDKIIITSVEDTLYNLTTVPANWYQIRTNSTGTTTMENTIIKYGGRYASSQDYIDFLTSTGNLTIKNSETSNVYGLNGIKCESGNLEILDSTITAGVNTSNLSNINIQRNTINRIYLSYTNTTLQNNIDIENNSLLGWIDFAPNILSAPIIKNNVVSTTTNSCVAIDLTKANKDVLQNISGNTNNQTVKYGEIQITAQSKNSEMNYPSRVYYIYNSPYAYNINSGTTINVEAGSTIKIPKTNSLYIEGTLNLNGTPDNKIVLTSLEDLGTNVVSMANGWVRLSVANNGNLNIDNAIIKYGGTNLYDNCDFMEVSNGNLSIKNSEVSNVYGRCGIKCYYGNVEIVNSNIEHSLKTTNLTNVSVKNSNLLGANIEYSNNTFQNNVDLEDNNIKNGIYYIPNVLSLPVIKNNTSISNYPMQIIGQNINPNLLQETSNNVNNTSVTYNGVYINGTINNLKLTNGNEYILGSLGISKDKLLEIEAGTKCKILKGTRIYVNGNLVVNGTPDNTVKFTNLTESNVDYGIGIFIENTGSALINNMEMNYCGYRYDAFTYYPCIENNGKLYMINSSISNAQSGQAIKYTTTNIDQILKYNYIGGSVVSTNLALDGTYNYWGASDGPRRYNSTTQNYEGSGSSIGTNILWNTYNASFLKSDLVLDTYINDVKRTEANHFGEAGVNGYTGNYSKTFDDLNVVIPNMDLKFTRAYNSKNNSSDVLGRGWSFGFSSRIDISPLNTNVMYAYLPNGSVDVFTKQSDGTFVSNDSRNTLTIESNKYVLTTKEQTRYLFNDSRYLYKIVDKYLNETNITVDSTGKVTQIVDYTGRTYTVTYTSGKVTKITDPLNRSVTYKYNTQGLLSEVIGLNGKSTYYEYDQNGYMTYIKEQNDLSQVITVESITYVSDGLNGSKVASIKDSAENTSTYTYNTVDKTTTIVDQNNRATISYYDASGYTTKVINQANLETNISYELQNGINSYGDVASKTDITGNTVTYERDAKGNITKQTNVDGTYKTYEYNNKNSVTKETDEAGNITSYAYASDGVTLTKKIMPNGGEINFEYYTTGIKGLVSKKTDENGNATTYEYDTKGNITKTTDSKGYASTFTYNALGFLMSKTTAEGYITTYEYDNVGNNTKITENNVSTINTYNYKNKLTSTTNANGNIISYEYDNNQNIVKKTDEEGNVTTYEYDMYGNVTKETKPNGAIYTYGYDNLDRNTSTQVLKDGVNTLLEEKSYSYLNGNKTTTTKTYLDSTKYITTVKVENYLDKVTSQSLEDATKTTTYTPNGLVLSEENEIGKKVYYTYNSIGKASTKYEEIDAGLYKLTTYNYDLCGNLIEEKTSQEKVALNTLPTSYIEATYTYDANNNCILKTTSSGEEFKYTYDKDKNTVKEEVKIEAGRYKTTDYTYNYAKKVTSKKEYIEKGSLVLNNIDDTELTTLDLTYEYDNMNNLLRETSPDQTITTYTYDKLNRELSKCVSKEAVSVTTSQAYLFDSKDKLISKTDANGNIYSYEYDIFGNITKETKPNNTVTNYYYDLIGNLLTEQLPIKSDTNQSTLDYTYDKYNNVATKIRTSIEDLVVTQITTSYEYDKSRNLLSETTANVTKSSTYNKAGKKISETDGNGNVTAYTYDASLNKVQEINSNGTVTKYFYDERNNLVKTTIDDVVDEENAYDLVNNKISEKDSLGKIIVNIYDICSNLVKQTDSSTGYEIRNQYTALKKVARVVDNYSKELKYTYDILGNKTSETEQKIDGTQSITTSTEYDNLSNKTKTIDGNGNVTTYIYDFLNNLITETNPLNQVTTYEYDTRGNKTKEIDYLGNELKYVYNELDRLVQKIDQYNNIIEKLEYDNLGRQIKSIDVNNNIIEYTYDGNDNVLTKKDQESKTETFEYDGLNNKTKYTDKNGNVTRYEYSNKNKVTKVTNALSEVTTYTYDNAGNLLTQEDARGNETTYQYDLNSNETKKIDQLGNEETKTYSPSGLMATFISNNGNTFIYDYDIHGRLVKETLGLEETTYEYDNNDNKTKIGNVTKTYDALDRVLTSTENSQTVTYSYDDTNKIKSITDPKGNVKTEEYDKANRLIKVTTGIEITEYVYNLDGSVQKQINPNTIATYEYYPDNKVKRLTTKDLSGNIIEESYYEYDSNNNVLIDNAKTYTYDVLNRIHTVTENAKTTTYSYDASGNILAKATLDGNTLKTISYLYNNKNQLLSTTTVDNLNPTSETTYTYDDNGNQITETTGTDVITNTYNARNELIQVEKGQDVSNYNYNAEGKRIQKIVGNTATNFVYDKDNIILELDNQNTQIATNTYGLALIKRNATSKGYYVYNAHGDVLKVLDENNNILNTYNYDEFGNIQDETGTFSNPFTYAGYYYDKETKTYYLQARYYNPAIQRFISEDTYRGELDDPLSLNLYTYVNNNPLIYVDPTGHFAEVVIGGAFASIISSIAAIPLTPILIGVGIGAAIVGTVIAVDYVLTNYSDEISQSINNVNESIQSQINTTANQEVGLYNNTGIINSTVKELDLTKVRIDAAIKENTKNRNVEKSYTVYTLNDSFGNVQYVGRTIDPIRRSNEHRNNTKKRNYSFNLVTSGLTQAQARVYEQVMISNYRMKKDGGVLDNLRNEIGRKNKNIYNYFNDFKELIEDKEVGNIIDRLENEYLDIKENIGL